MSCQVVCRFDTGSRENSGLKIYKYKDLFTKNKMLQGNIKLFRHWGAEDQPDWPQDAQWTDRELKTRHRIYRWGNEEMIANTWEETWGSDVQRGRTLGLCLRAGPNTHITPYTPLWSAYSVEVHIRVWVLRLQACKNWRIGTVWVESSTCASAS